MKNRLAVALAGLAFGFVLPTFAQQKDTVDPQIAEQIRALALKYDEAKNKYDVAAVAALFTEDGVRVTPHDGAFHGRQAIEKSYAHEVQRWQFSNVVTRVDRVIAVGNEVRAHGRWSADYKETNGGASSDGGPYSWVIVREGDTWKIRRDTESSSKINATN
jgi:uncharacterized protein (TIGR02246 family)